MRSSSLVAILLCLCVSAEDIPGHLQPIGSHQPPEAPIKEVRGFPSPLEFYDEYVVKSQPVLMKGAAKELPIFDTWTDEYMKAKFGHEFVEVEEGKKEDRDLSMWTDTFKGFLTKYQGKDPTDRFKGNFYSVSAVPASMRAEYHIPRSVDCKPFLKNRAGGMRQFNHWFSSGGTSSVLHHDGFENLNCLLAGTKDLTFIDRTYTHKDLHWDSRPNHGHSYIDTDKVDMIKYPNFRNIKYRKVHMERGDCLFIPYQWFHNVRSHADKDLQKNHALNLWWEMEKSPQEREQVAKCVDPGPGKDNAKKTTVASKVEFTRDQWPEPPGAQGGGGDGGPEEGNDGADGDDDL